MACLGALTDSSRARSSPPNAWGRVQVSPQPRQNGAAAAVDTHRLHEAQVGPNVLPRDGDVEGVANQQADMVCTHHVHAANCARHVSAAEAGW
jgi:hypothetical protein